MKNNLTHISSILDKALKAYRPKKDMDMTKIWDSWESAVGSEVAKNAKPSSLKDGTLIVNVSSSVWMQHLSFLKKDMISNLNHLINKQSVTAIKFKIGKLHN